MNHKRLVSQMVRLTLIALLLTACSAAHPTSTPVTCNCSTCNRTAYCHAAYTRTSHTCAAYTHTAYGCGCLEPFPSGLCLDGLRRRVRPGHLVWRPDRKLSGTPATTMTRPGPTMWPPTNGPR